MAEKSHAPGRETILTHGGCIPGASGHRQPAGLPGLHHPLPHPGRPDGQPARRLRGLTYGLSGTPTTFALTDTLAALEGGAGTLVLSSGLSAITQGILGLVKAGDHILVTDSVYGPTRLFCDQVLARFGVATTYYDPLIGEGIAELIRPETRLVFTESPGSLTFEVQDLPAIAAAAHRRGVLVLLDNTWATPLYFPAFERGADVAIQAGTKYIAGHSDLVLGVVTARAPEVFKAIKTSVDRLGDSVAPDVCYLALRGLRTMALRLGHQGETGLELARWLTRRPEVARVLHPALPGDPGHELWKRDFTGCAGLFAFALETEDVKAVGAMLDGLHLFGMGYSWGGFESLIIPANPQYTRSATQWQQPGYLLRLNVGLEDLDDLKADLAEGFARLNQALA